MTLTTHAITGAAIASAFSLNPVAALTAGFLSHFLLDRIPHYDYKLNSAKIDEENLLEIDLPLIHEAIGDLMKIGFDFLLGLSLAIIFFTSNGQGNWLIILIGALGGTLPDALQFAYMKIRREPFTTYQRWHNFMSSPAKIKHPVWGILWQVLIILIALILGNWQFFIL